MPLLLKEVATTVTLPPIAFDVPDIHSRYVRISLVEASGASYIYFSTFKNRYLYGNCANGVGREVLFGA